MTHPDPLLLRPHGKKPVILQVLPALESGGAEQGCIDVAGAITQAGGTAIVACQSGTKQRLHDLARAGGVQIDLPLASKNPFVIWRNIARLKKIIHDHQVDVIHARSRAPAWSAFYAARATGIPFITTCHAPYNTQNEWKRKYNAIMGRGARVIAISHFVADYLRRELGVPHDRLRVIHRGLSLARFHPAAVTPERVIKVSQAWRIPDGATVIMLPGRLTRWKGQLVFIDALAKINRDDLFAVLVGSDQGRGDYTQELLDHITTRGLAGRVRIVDHCDDMPAAYMAAHIVVSASTDPEGFGRVAIEGQGMGRLVIATGHGGSQETIIDKVTGWLVKPNDADDLARALERAITLPLENRAELGTNGMMHVAQNFTVGHMTAQTIAVYNEILGAAVKTA